MDCSPMLFSKQCCRIWSQNKHNPSIAWLALSDDQLLLKCHEHCLLSTLQMWHKLIKYETNNIY